MPHHFALAFDSESVHAFWSVSLSLPAIVLVRSFIAPHIARRDSIHDTSLHLMRLDLLHRRQPGLTTLCHVASNAGHPSSWKRCVPGLREMSRDVAEGQSTRRPTCPPLDCFPPPSSLLVGHLPKPSTNEWLVAADRSPSPSPDAATIRARPLPGYTPTGVKEPS